MIDISVLCQDVNTIKGLFDGIIKNTRKKYVNEKSEEYKAFFKYKIYELVSYSYEMNKLDIIKYLYLNSENFVEIFLTIVKKKDITFAKKLFNVRSFKFDCLETVQVELGIYNNFSCLMLFCLNINNLNLLYELFNYDLINNKLYLFMNSLLIYEVKDMNVFEKIFCNLYPRMSKDNLVTYFKNSCFYFQKPKIRFLYNYIKHFGQYYFSNNLFPEKKSELFMKGIGFYKYEKDVFDNQLNTQNIPSSIININIPNRNYIIEPIKPIEKTLLKPTLVIKPIIPTNVNPNVIINPFTNTSINYEKSNKTKQFIENVVNDIIDNVVNLTENKGSIEYLEDGILSFISAPNEMVVSSSTFIQYRTMTIVESPNSMNELEEMLDYI
jgi:hypothetical protein